MSIEPIAELEAEELVDELEFVRWVDLALGSDARATYA
jgi:hypothetical protein